jgi:hypothetical protein
MINWPIFSSSDSFLSVDFAHFSPLASKWTAVSPEQ